MTVLAHERPSNTQELLRKFVRARRSPALSTGAYGDEGALLFELEEVFWRDYGAQADQWLRADLAAMPADYREHIIRSVGVAVDRHAPLRFSIQEDIADLIGQEVETRLRMVEMDPEDYQRLKTRLDSTVLTRGLFEIPRGSEVWQVLAQADLLAILGAFLLERE